MGTCLPKTCKRCIMTVQENTLLMLERRGFEIKICESSDCYLRIPEALVVFVMNEKVTINHMKNVLSMRIGAERIVIIHGKTITSDAKNIIARTDDIETFTADEMGFDLLKIVPVHTKVLEQPHKDWKLFPVLKTSDIVCRYFGFKTGDVIKVDDSGEIMYRRVL